MKSVLIFSSCVVGGCVGEEAFDDTSVVELAATSESPGTNGTGGSCPTWGCGGNTSLMHGIPFIDLNLQGAYNNADFRIVKFEKAEVLNGHEYWVRLTPEVVDARLRGINPRGVVLTGSQLVGARFELYNRYNGISYHLIVTGVSTMRMWPTPGGSTFTYQLFWTFKPGQYDANGRLLALKKPEPICGENPEGDGLADFTAVLFENDRIDEDGIRVYAEQSGWFNIGCAGHALAKQHLLGHTSAARRLMLAAPISLERRTANLKMITADYCGGGHPFTVPGQKLRWRDADGRYDSLPTQDELETNGGEIEARWSENGAFCLNTPRVDFNGGSPTFPDGVEALLPPISTRWCATEIPACTGTMSEMQGAAVISVNYHAPTTP